MGVAGSGKSTVGRILAHELGWPFYEGDDFHPRANIAKMRSAVALTDADREAWLAALARLIRKLDRSGRKAVVACSALKQAYRETLAGKTGNVRFVYLRGSINLIRKRLLSRQEHYFKADLLKNQFDILEEPENAVVVDAAIPPPAIVEQIRLALSV